MRKSVHRAGRRTNARRSRGPRSGIATRRSALPARRDTADPRRLLERILDTPHLAQVVPQLPSDLLHRVIQSCGLEDCGDLVALATPKQLAGVFDLDLWRTSQAGSDEQFDADRFGLWLEVLLESGAAVAAQRLAQMELELVIAALAQHTRVFDQAAVVPAAADGELVDPGRALGDLGGCDVGGYRLVARRTGSWDAIVEVLTALAVEYPESFHRVMGGCRRLSNSAPEVDGLDDLLPVGDQIMFDLAFDREQRREKQGFATPPQARAFLQMARQFRPGQDTPQPGNPVARAYFRAIEPTPSTEAVPVSRRLPAASGEAATPESSADAIAAVVDVLLEAGVLPQHARALLDGPQAQAPRLARMQTHMEAVRDRDLAAYSMRSQELAYLANTLVAGCSIQARAVTPQEASDLAVAVCNLGLENWPAEPLPAADHRFSVAEDRAPLPDDFLVGHDLVTVFQVGWTALHENVCMYTAERLSDVLSSLRSDDREIQGGLRALRVEMAKHRQAGEPWRAREALDVIAILDMPAWATLVGLIDECPVIHAGIDASRGERGSRPLAISASAFEFISENRQIGSVHEFMRSLPEILRS